MVIAETKKKMEASHEHRPDSNHWFLRQCELTIRSVGGLFERQYGGIALRRCLCGALMYSSCGAHGKGSLGPVGAGLCCELGLVCGARLRG